VLLYGLIAKSGRAKEFQVVGDFLSYDPYGIMYRKGDPDFADVVKDAFERLATRASWSRPTTSGSASSCPTASASICR